MTAHILWRNLTICPCSGATLLFVIYSYRFFLKKFLDCICMALYMKGLASNFLNVGLGCSSSAHWHQSWRRCPDKDPSCRSIHPLRHMQFPRPSMPSVSVTSGPRLRDFRSSECLPDLEQHSPLRHLRQYEDRRGQNQAWQRGDINARFSAMTSHYLLDVVWLWVAVRELTIGSVFPYRSSICHSTLYFH